MTFDQFTESLPEPELTENAKIVLTERYLAKEDGKIIETPKTMFARVAWAVAKGSEKYAAREEVARAYYDLMISGRFIPNSPTLMNAGRSLGLLSACFVLPVEDECESIFSTNTAIGMIQRAGGGTGISLDRLRPCGSIVKSSGGTTSGPITFWRMFHATTEAIQQGAFRRGANMGMMSIHHPDVLKFIFAKQSLKELTSYNISVKVPNQFMETLETKPDTLWSLFDPLGEKEYFMPRSVLKTVIENVGKRDYKGTVTLDTCYTINNLKDDPDEKDLLTIGEIFNIIVRNAWRTGEPGLFFIDKADDANPTPELGEYEATNPCGEQPLLPYESCNLGSINLSKFVKSTKSNGPTFMWKELDTAVRTAVEFLDDVIEINKFPLPELETASKLTRKIGLGVMGFADTLFKMRVPYDSKEALDFGEKVMAAVQHSSHLRSHELGKERGCFKAWKGSKYGESEHAMRNACTTTVAPTGTISIIADCSSGIEPLFSLAFERRVMGKKLIEINKEFAAELKKAVASEKQFEDVVGAAITKGSIQTLEELPKDFRMLFKTAHDIQPHFHVDIQAAFQKNCDSSISKTVNLPNNAAHEEVGRIFQRAFRSGCKGITVYRHKCRDVQPMGLKGDEAELVGKKIRVPAIGPEFYYRFQTPTGELRVHIRYNPEDEKDVWEVYSTCTSGNSEIYLWADAICSTISIGLRHGTPATAYLKRLRKFISTLPANGVGVWSTQSGPQAVGRALELWLSGCKTVKQAAKYFGSDEFGEVGNDESIWDICPKCKQPTWGPDPGCRSGKKCRSCHHSDGACAGS